jgi:hypothetical protein
MSCDKVVEQQDEELPRKVLEPPSATLNNSINSMNGAPDSAKGKERCRVTISYKDQVQKICWYGEDTPAKNIEDVIRTAFGLPHHAALLLRNADGDNVAVSSSLPPNEIFKLQVCGGSRGEAGEDGNESDVKHEGDSQGSDGSPSSPSSPSVLSVQEDSPSPIPIKV